MPQKLDEYDVTGMETLDLHLERYRYSASQQAGGRVLDIACGVGYGTRLLADECDNLSEVVGVDLSGSAIAYADEHYKRDGVNFVNSDALSFVDSELFDGVVSLETIEHLPEPDEFLDNVTKLLRVGGTFVASVPVTPSVDVNPFHLHDFTEKTFRDMFLSRGFKEITSMIQVQPYNPVPLLARKEKRASTIRPKLLKYYMQNPTKLALRLWTSVRYGFENRYLTVVWEKQERL